MICRFMEGRLERSRMDKMWAFIQNFILEYVEIWSLYLLALKTLKRKNIFSVSTFFVQLLGALIMTAIELFSLSDVWVTMLQYIVFMVVLWVLFKESYLSTVYLTLFVFLCNISIQFSTMLPIAIAGVSPESSVIQYIGSGATLAIVLLVFYFAPLDRLWKFIFHSDFRFFMLSMNVALFSIGLLLSYKLYQEHFFANYIIYFLFLSIIVLMNWELFHVRAKWKDEQKELEAYQQYMPIIEELLDEVRIRQHNFDNTTQAILNLHHTNPDYESLVNAMENYGKVAFSNNLPSHLLKLNYKLVIGFLYMKENNANKQGKFIDIIIRNYVLQTVLPEHILVEMLGILIDNALEAVPRGESISLTLDSNSGKVACEVRNAGTVIDGELLTKMFEKGYTTKNDRSAQHGLGLFYLKKKVQEYNGTISVRNETFHGQNYVTFSLLI